MIAPAPGGAAKSGLAALITGCAIFAAALSPQSVNASEVLAIEIKVADARVDPQTKKSVIFVKLTDESKRLVAEMTTKNVGKSTEFRVDGRVLMKPVIREPLLAGVFEISGNHSLNEAKDIAKRMTTSGAKIEIAIVE